MIFEKFSSNVKTMQSENSWGRIIIAAMLVIIGLLSYKVITQEVVVTLVPPGLTKEAQVHKDKADASIHKAWGLYMAESFGNVTPSTASFLRVTMDQLLAPEIRQEALVLLDKQIDIIKRDQVSFSFEPREVIFDDKTGKTYVVGRHYTHQAIGDPLRSNRTYEFSFEYKNYLPSLVGLDTYEGAPRLKTNKE